MPIMWNICISICGATDDPRVNAKAQSASDSHMLQGTFRPAGSNRCFFPRRDMKHLLPEFNSVKIAIRIPLIWIPGIMICKLKVRLSHKIETRVQVEKSCVAYPQRGAVRHQDKPYTLPLEYQEQNSCKMWGGARQMLYL